MAIKKQEFDYKEKYSTKTKYKETSFYYCGQAFADACGLPGPVMGGINMMLGHSNAGKTTGLILAAADCQKKGDLPVFIITEKKWDWMHATQLGLMATKDENGEWKGDFIFNDSFEFIEQMTDFMNEILNEQEKGNIPRNICFFIDSIGSIPCEMTFNGSGGTQHNARILSEKFGMGLHSRITKTKKEEYPYINTIVVTNQPWVELPDNIYGQPKIRPKGGNAIYLASSLVFLYGNEKNSGVTFLEATKNKRKVSYATRSKISVLKNHVNGIQYRDGKVIITPQSIIEDTPESLEKYKAQYSEYWSTILGGTDYQISENNNVIDVVDNNE